MTTENPKDKIATTNSQLTALGSERALYLNDHVVDRIDGDNLIMACDEYIQIGTVPLNGLIHTKLGGSALFKLFNDSSGLRSSAVDILALKIHFAVNENNTLYFYYQPIAAKLNEEFHDPHNRKQGLFLVIKEGPIYEYVNFSFKEITDSGLPTARYEERTQIYRHGSINAYKGINEEDTKATIFSFQEIFALMHDNDDSQELNIFNCIKRIPQINHNFEVKHSLLLATFSLRPAYNLKRFQKFSLGDADTISSSLIIPIDFKGLYANLTHLCPPNCSRLIYPLES
jgi:hypothetical protein